MDRSIRFYCDNFGFVETLRHPPNVERPLDRVIGVPGARAEIVLLQLEGFILELFRYEVPIGRPVATTLSQADHGFTHIGFRVDDIQTETERLRGAGVSFLGDPVQWREGVWVVYFRGPDGEVGELRQLPQGA
jgi:glyoxylase I family protein